MVEINSIFHHKPLTISLLSFKISLLSMFPLRIFLNKNLLKVSSMKDHHAKSVGSLEIKPWIVITGWILLIKAKIPHKNLLPWPVCLMQLSPTIKIHGWLILVHLIISLPISIISQFNLSTRGHNKLLLGMVNPYQSTT